MSIACRCALHMLNFYQRWLSLYIGGHCRFVPSCSQYAQIAFRKYGFMQGCWLTVKRLAKCHPGYKGSWYDPL